MPKLPDHSQVMAPEAPFIEGIDFGPPKLSPDDPLQPLFRHVLGREGYREPDIRLLCIQMAVNAHLGRLVGIRERPILGMIGGLVHVLLLGRGSMPAEELRERVVTEVRTAFASIEPIISPLKSGMN